MTTSTKIALEREIWIEYKEKIKDFIDAYVTALNLMKNEGKYVLAESDSKYQCAYFIVKEYMKTYKNGLSLTDRIAVIEVETFQNTKEIQLKLDQEVFNMNSGELVDFFDLKIKDLVDAGAIVLRYDVSHLEDLRLILSRLVLL